MRILHVIRDLARSTGGPVNALNGLASAQARAGHRVAILAGDSGGDKIIPAGVETHLVPMRWDNWHWSPSLKSSLQALLPSCDIVHGHMIWDYPVWEAARQARRFKKPFVLRPCGNLERWSISQKRLKKTLYLRMFGSVVRSAAAIHFTSEGERTESAFVTGHHASAVIPLGVLPEFIACADSSSFGDQFPDLAGMQIVLYLGRLHPKKQPDLVIEAFAAIAGSSPLRHLVLAGPVDDAYLSVLRSLVAKLGIADRVTFTGQLDSEAVRVAFSASDVFVLPSQQENFGIAVVESMASACPVVISDRVGIAREIIEAGAGIVCPIEPRSIAHALQSILDDRALRQRMGDAGRDLVAARYTWPRIADQVLEFYLTIIARYNSAQGGNTA